MDVKAQQQLLDAATLESLVQEKGIPENPVLLKRWRGEMKPVGCSAPPAAVPEQKQLWD
jgi:hypothetical protein